MDNKEQLSKEQIKQNSTKTAIVGFVASNVKQKENIYKQCKIINANNSSIIVNRTARFI